MTHLNNKQQKDEYFNRNLTINFRELEQTDENNLFEIGSDPEFHLYIEK
ncbi:MAG: hypothetical protein JST62_14410 [Bacteroidetes bacterium]|jgi:hypothetical protein|nr:hypothetical protein [Bacteroidota bacterium]